MVQLRYYHMGNYNGVILARIRGGRKGEGQICPRSGGFRDHVA